jgi:hypothetical protein
MSLVFVTQFTIAASGTRDANCITQLRGPRKITHFCRPLTDRLSRQA